MQTITVVAAMVLAGLWSGALGLLHIRGETSFLDRGEAALVDLRMLVRGPIPPPQNITLITIDNETVKVEGRHPLRRSTLARLIEEAGRRGADAIAVDLLLVDASDEQSDVELARSMTIAPTAIAAAATFRGGKQWIDPSSDDFQTQIPNAETFLLPLQIFADSAAIGIVNVATDATGSPRSVPLLFRLGTRVEPALALRIASLVTHTDPEISPEGIRVGGRQIFTDAGYLMHLNFYGPQGTIPSISAADVLSGRVDGQALQNRVAVIGSTVTGGGDVFPTPFDPVLPGAEVMATAIANILAGDGILRDNRVRIADAAISFVLPLLFILLLSWRRSGAALASILAILLLLTAGNVFAFANGTWLSAALPLVAAAPPAVLFLATQLWLNRSQAQRFANQSSLLQRVQAPGLGDWLAEHSNFLEKPVRLNASVVFVDLSGFTGFSEAAGANVARDILNEFHGLVDEVAISSGGVVTSFMGDGAMILFGLPEPRDEDPRNAIQCCTVLARQMDSWLASPQRPLHSHLGYKIGAHSGEVVASRLGGDGQQHIAATGDVVNVASRLMEVAASNEVDLALSDEIILSSGDRSAVHNTGRLRGPVKTFIRGRSGSLSVWLWSAGAS